MNIAFRIIMYLVIISIVRVVIGKLLNPSENGKTDKEGVYHIKKTLLGNIYMACAVVVTILIIAIGSLAIGGIQMLIVGLVAIGLNIILYLAAFMYYLYEIRVEKESIEVRTYTGRKKSIPYNSISDGMVDEYGQLYLYRDGSILLKIDSLSKYAIVLDKLKKNKIPVRSKSSIDDFTLEETRGMKILRCIVAVCGGGLVAINIAGKNVIGICLFSVVTIAAVYICMKSLVGKVQIVKGMIIEKKVFSGEKAIPFSQVQYLTSKSGDNAQITEIHTKDNQVVKISSQFKNAGLFYAVVDRERWVWKK